MRQLDEGFGSVLCAVRRSPRERSRAVQPAVCGHRIHVAAGGAQRDKHAPEADLQQGVRGARVRHKKAPHTQA